MGTYKVHIRKPESTSTWDLVQTIVAKDPETAIKNAYDSWVASKPEHLQSPLKACTTKAIHLGVPKSQSRLEDVISASEPDQKPFQDSDGLISFVNLSSSFVADSKEFTNGRNVCDKVCNFFATLRPKVFAYLQKNPSKVISPDATPTNQWDYAVTDYMYYLLKEAGGFAEYKMVSETYSVTQVITEFNANLIKLIFDAASCPPAILDAVLNFVQGIGQTLRTQWNDKSKHYSNSLMGQCHEAVPIDAQGNTIYFPKVKYYYISVDSSQTAFTSNCAKVEKLTFDFKYEYLVTALKASILDENSDDYKNFVKFLDKAQGIAYKDANNNLDGILDDTTSNHPSSNEIIPLDGSNIFGVDLLEYPKITTLG